MNEEKFFTETGSIAYCSNFRELRTMYGLKKAVLARYNRCLYIVRLWILREVSIMQTLIENFDKIPRKSFSYRITSIFARSARMKKLLDNLGMKYKNKLTFHI